MKYAFLTVKQTVTMLAVRKNKKSEGGEKGHGRVNYKRGREIKMAKQKIKKSQKQQSLLYYIHSIGYLGRNMNTELFCQWNHAL